MNEKDWNNFESIITFKECVNCDADVMKSNLCTITELIKSGLPYAHLSSEKEQECDKVIPLSFEDVSDIIGILVFFCCCCFF